MKQVRWGMVGCGAVTEIKSGPAFSLVEGSKLSAVAARRPEAAEDYAKRHGVPKVFKSIDDLISDELIDAVYIATPPSSHLHYALKVAEQGKPCCVEKPMALNDRECTKMLKEFEKRGLPLFVSYYRRSLPRFLKVREWLQCGLIGEPREVRWTLSKPPSQIDVEQRPNWRTDPLESPGGYFSDLASHGINLLQFLLGDISSAQGVTASQLGLYEAEDMVAASWQFANQAVGVGTWNFGAQKREDTVFIAGTQGQLSFSVFDEVPLKIESAKISMELFIENPPNIQLHHVRNMMSHLRGEAEHPSLGAAAAETNRIMSMILDTSGRARIRQAHNSDGAIHDRK